MDALSFVLTDVFDNGATIPPVSQEEESQLIDAARRGDSDAVVSLIRLYAPCLRNAAARYGGPLDPEEVRSVAMTTLVEAVHDTAPGDRLAATLKARLRWALTDAATHSAKFAIPERTARRFFSILRKADGDLEAAERLAPDHGMSVATFRAVLDAVRRCTSLEGEAERASDEDGTPRTVDSLDLTSLYAAQEISDATARELVDLAFEAVEGPDEDIVRMAYGFTDYEPVPDAEIAHRLGMTRPTVQRRRARAIEKMRVRVGA